MRSSSVHSVIERLPGEYPYATSAPVPLACGNGKEQLLRQINLQTCRVSESKLKFMEISWRLLILQIVQRVADFRISRLSTKSALNLGRLYRQ
jgi:hypothetical protein